MSYAAITWIALAALSLGMSCAEHGKQRRPHNAWISAFACGIHVLLLWWGGFFS